MKCEIIKDLLPLYLNNECSEETKTMIEEHLSTCEECRALFKECEQIEQEEKPVIPQASVFKKVRRKIILTIVSIALFMMAFVFMFGSRISSEFIKWRFMQYIDRNYSQYDLNTGDFSYVDPSSNGFGINNGFYAMNVYDSELEDVKFNIITEGFFMRITDNYSNQVEGRERTLGRLENEYKNDLIDVMLKEMSGRFKDCWVHMSMSDEQKSMLEIDEPYKRSFDQIADVQIHLELYATQEEVSDINAYIQGLVDLIHEQEFYPSSMNLLLWVDGRQWNIDFFDCEEDLTKTEFKVNIH